MKKLIIFILLVLMVLTGCQRSSNIHTFIEANTHHCSIDQRLNEAYTKAFIESQMKTVHDEQNALKQAKETK